MLIFRLFLPCVHSNLLTANFILLRLPYFESITTCCVHLIVVKSLLLSFLISLLLLTQLIIKSCLIDLLPSMVSQVLPSPYFDPIFLIALIMLLFNLPPLLLSTLLLVSLRVLSLILSNQIKSNDFTERQVRGQDHFGDASQYHRSLSVHHPSG